MGLPGASTCNKCLGPALATNALPEMTCIAQRAAADGIIVDCTRCMQNLVQPTTANAISICLASLVNQVALLRQSYNLDVHALGSDSDHGKLMP